MRILYIQDEKVTARCVTLAMQREGIVIITADNIEGARERIKFDTFDFLMFDLDLKSFDVLKLYESIKASIKVPILFIAEKPLDENLLYSLNLNKNNILLKPISIKGILKTLDKLKLIYRIN